MGGLMMKAKAYTPVVQRYVWEVGVGLGGCWGDGGAYDESEGLHSSCTEVCVGGGGGVGWVLGGVGGWGGL